MMQSPSMLFSSSSRLKKPWSCFLFLFLVLVLPPNFFFSTEATYYSPFQFSDDEQEERILAALEKVDDVDPWSSTKEELSDSYETLVDQETPRNSDKGRRNCKRKPHSSLLRKRRPKVSLKQKEPRREAATVSPKVVKGKVQRNSTSAPTSTQATPSTSMAPALQDTPRSSTSQDWIRHFIAQCHRDVLLPVPIDFIVDNFNLAHLAPLIEDVGLQATQNERSSSVESLPPRPQREESTATLNTGSSSSSFPIYRQALRLLVDGRTNSTDIPDILDRATRALYLMIHQRYVLSPRGLDMVRRRFLLSKQTDPRKGIDPIFGRCPRLLCRGMPLLPYGDSDVCSFSSSKQSSDPTEAAWNLKAKRYCCSCRRVWYHWDSQVDGCSWGPSFCHLFLMTCGQEVFGDEIVRLGCHHKPTQNEVNHGDETPIPRIFGFRLHPQASMSWNP